MFKLSIYNTALVPTDYTGNLVPGWNIQEGLNVPTTFTFSIAPIGRSFVAPPQRAYVKLYSTNTGKSLFTGFISSAPTLSFLGLSSLAPSGMGGQLLTYQIVATSDEYLLNVKAVPFIPNFVNQYQGRILASIAEKLCPGFFDTSLIADGDLVPFYKYDPTQSWCEIAKTFADASRYRYKVKDKVIQYQPYGDMDLGIAYDESQPVSTFSAADLSTTVMTVPIVNDVTIIGGVEAGNNHEDYFLGDGFTANMPLWHEVFHGYSSLQLQESWNETYLNTTNWFQWGPEGFFNYSAGALNVVDIGPRGNGSVVSPMPPLGESYLSANNGIEIAGGIDLQVGEVSFNDICFGILGGVFTAEDMTANEFLCGYAISSPNGVLQGATGAGPIPGAAVGVSGVLIQPSGAFAGVAYAGPVVCTQWNHTYALLMTMNAPAQSRYTQVFRTLNGTQYGGEEADMTGSVTWQIQDYDIAAASSPTGFFYMPKITTYTVNNVPLPAFGIYAVVNNQQLNITIGGGSGTASGTTIASIPVGGLFTADGPRGMFMPTGDILPMLPPGSGGFIGPVLPWPSLASGNILPGPLQRSSLQTAQMLGNGLDLQAAQITEQSSTDTLAFFAQTTPAAGTPIRFQSWEAQAAVSRLQLSGSIATEAVIVGDDGIRSAIVSNLSPLPETSEDCDNAALAFLTDRSEVDYNGTYSCTSMFFKSPTVAFSTTAYTPSASGGYRFNGGTGITHASFSVLHSGFIMDQVTLTLSSSLSGASGSVTVALYGSAGLGPGSAIVELGVIDDSSLSPNLWQYTLSGFVPQALPPGVYWIGVGTGYSYAEWWATQDLSGYGASEGSYATATAVFSNAGSKAFQMQITGTGNEGTDLQYYPTAGRFMLVNAPARGIVNQNMLVSALTISDLDFKTELLQYQVTFGADMHLEKLLQHFVNPYPTSILTTKDAANPPNPILTQNVDNSFLPDLQNIQFDTDAITPSSVTVVVNDSYIGNIEIRNIDSNWGHGNTPDLVGIQSVVGPGARFTLHRSNMDQAWFMRASSTSAFGSATGDYTVSRRSKVLRTYWPMKPSPPFLESVTQITGSFPDDTPYPSAALQYNYQGDQRSIYGFELRAADNTTILVQCFATYGSMYVDLTQTPWLYLSPELATDDTFYAYFFNQQWDYSEPTVTELSGAGGSGGIRSAYPWCPGIEAPLIGDAIYPEYSSIAAIASGNFHSSGPGTFTMAPQYGLDAAGGPIVGMSITGRLPFNVISSDAPPQISVQAVGDRASTIPVGNYVVAGAAADGSEPSCLYSDYFGLDYVNIHEASTRIDVGIVRERGDQAVDIYIASDSWGQASDYGISGKPYAWHYNQTVAASGTSATILEFDQSTPGGPDPEFDHLHIFFMQMVHGGCWAQQVQGVTTSTITFGSAGMTTNQWAGYNLSLLARWDYTQDLIVLNMPVASSTASASGQFTVTIGQNSAGYGLPDLTTLLAVGDLLVCRFNPTFTATSMTDPNIANPYYPTGDDPSIDSNIPNYVAVVLTGVDAGDVQPIANSSGAPGIYTTYNLVYQWAVTPNTGDLVTICNPGIAFDWVSPTLYGQNRSMSLYSVTPQIPNLAGSQWLVTVQAEGVNGSYSPGNPQRDTYIYGGQAIRAVSASGTIATRLTDGMVRFL